MPSPTPPPPKLVKVALLPGKERYILIAPGQSIADVPSGEVRRLAVADLVPTGEPNTYRAVARVHSAEIKLTDHSVERLNLGVDARVLKRLIKAGFVKGGRISPQCYVFDLESYYAHVAAVRDDPDFWTTENLQRYRAATAC